MTPLLAVSGLSKRFGGLRALDGVGFAVAPGEILGVIGPNGAGKTTLFGALAGLVRPDAGSIRLGGREVAGEPARRVAALGMVKTFQNAALFADATVLDNVLVAALLRAPRVREARALARATLERCGLGHLADRRAGDLTFPERARVETARALATRPRVLLLDEAMASLNPVEMDEQSALVRSLREDGLTVLVVEHHMRAITALCDRVLVLNFGERIALGTPGTVARDPEVVRAYLGGEARLLVEGARVA